MPEPSTCRPSARSRHRRLLASWLVAAALGTAAASRPAQAAQVEPPQLPLGFTDVPVDHPATPSIYLLQARGILAGYPDGTFGGERPVTRYELAAVAARLYQALGADAQAAWRLDVGPLRQQQAELGAELQQLAEQVAARLRALEEESRLLRAEVERLQGEATALREALAAAQQLAAQQAEAARREARTWHWLAGGALLALLVWASR